MKEYIYIQHRGENMSESNYLLLCDACKNAQLQPRSRPDFIDTALRSHVKTACECEDQQNESDL